MRVAVGDCPVCGDTVDEVRIPVGQHVPTVRDHRWFDPVPPPAAELVPCGHELRVDEGWRVVLNEQQVRFMRDVHLPRWTSRRS
ncbi:MAG: hypothetical protein ACOC9R_01325 [bacterium]